MQISPVVAYPSPLPESIRKMEFVLIPEGEFMIGSPDDEVGRYDSEGPVHKVTIKNPFNLGKYPVTQKQWVAIMGSNPSRFKGDDLPVEQVSWDDVQEFIQKLNEMERTDKYRLPSEAEWEYACRAGTTTRYSFGDDESKLDEYAWYSGDATYNEWDQNHYKIQKEGSTHPGDQKNPNKWGLYDMHGNVWELCQDSWHDNYNEAPSDGRAWKDGNSSVRVIRGGGWNLHAASCRSANRSKNYPVDSYDYISFRLLKEL
ncbi:MAG: formylglycine-generating enzyme family protein [Methanosarcina sp.]